MNDESYFYQRDDRTGLYTHYYTGDPDKCENLVKFIEKGEISWKGNDLAHNFGTLFSIPTGKLWMWKVP